MQDPKSHKAKITEPQVETQVSLNPLQFAQNVTGVCSSAFCLLFTVNTRKITSFPLGTMFLYPYN